MYKVVKFITKFENRIGMRVYVKSEEAFGNISDFTFRTNGDENINHGIDVFYRVCFPFEEVTVHETDLILYLQ